MPAGLECCETLELRGKILNHKEDHKRENFTSVQHLPFDVFFDPSHWVDWPGGLAGGQFSWSVAQDFQISRIEGSTGFPRLQDGTQWYTNLFLKLSLLWSDGFTSHAPHVPLSGFSWKETWGNSYTPIEAAKVVWHKSIGFWWASCNYSWTCIKQIQPKSTFKNHNWTMQKITHKLYIHKT